LHDFKNFSSKAVGRRLSGFNHPYAWLDMAGHSSLIGIVGLAHSPEKGLYSGSHCRRWNEEREGGRRMGGVARLGLNR
jgi:hypothetical protein